MRHIGADLHKKSITFCVVELESGKTVVKHRRRMLCSAMLKLEEFLESQKPYTLVVETTIGFDWFADRFTPNSPTKAPPGYHRLTDRRSPMRCARG